MQQAKAQESAARGNQHTFVHHQIGLSMADAAQGISLMAECVLLFQEMEAGRCPGKGARCPGIRYPQGQRQKDHPVSGHHRQPKCQTFRPGTGKLRLRRGEEDNGAKTAYRNGHLGTANGSGRTYGQRPRQCGGQGGLPGPAKEIPKGYHKGLRRWGLQGCDLKGLGGGKLRLGPRNRKKERCP